MRDLTDGAATEAHAGPGSGTAMRSALTSLLTNLELTHRHLCRLPPEGPVSPDEREALERLTRDAIRSAEELRAQLRRPRSLG